jgi:hypothetical protein
MPLAGPALSQLPPPTEQIARGVSRNPPDLFRRPNIRRLSK